jgi:PIN domain nuclease of toxin-antitoxin system
VRVLLDSHAFLWWCSDDPRLPPRIRRAITAHSTACWLSHASVWELAIKVSLGKLKLGRPVDAFVREQCELNAFQLLPIEFRHVCRVESLDWHHRDPFDRLLVAQALIEDMALATVDRDMARYGVSVL